MPKILRDEDADLTVLKGKRIVILGPLSGGRNGLMYARNMKDSGIDVIFGLHGKDKKETDEKISKVKSEGFEGSVADEAVKNSDIVYTLLGDTDTPVIHQQHVIPNLTEGKTLAFMTGFPIHYKQVVPPSFVDVILVAPKAPAPAIREMFANGFGVPGLVAVYQDYSGKARDTALALAKSLGFTRAGVLETTFKDETETDLVGEQIGWGILLDQINAAYETLVHKGYPAELVYFEVCHEAKMIMDLIYRGGLSGMLGNISDTARFGVLTRGPRLIDSHVRESMRKVMEEVISGQFAQEWIEEQKNGLPKSKALAERVKLLQIEEVGASVRKMAGLT